VDDGLECVFYISNSDNFFFSHFIFLSFFLMRFHKLTQKDWTLQIKYVQSRDAGLYECQVRTNHRVLLKLNVEVKKMECVSKSLGWQNDVQVENLRKKYKLRCRGKKFITEHDSVA
jgi:hypothetical protein